MNSLQFQIAWNGKAYDVLADVDTNIEQMGADANGMGGIDCVFWDLIGLAIFDDGRDVTSLMEPLIYDLIEKEIEHEVKL